MTTPTDDSDLRGLLAEAVSDVRPRGGPEEIRERALAAAEAEIREETVNPVEDSVNEGRKDDATTAVEPNRR